MIPRRPGVAARSLSPLAALAAALALPPTASADGVRLTNTATAQYRLYRFVSGERQGEEVPYGLLLDRLNLVGAAGDFTGSARIDGMLFIDPPEQPPGEGEFRDDARVERLTVGYRIGAGAGDVELTVGDFYRQLGRGILLSLRKEDEIGVDIALRGGQAAYVGEVFDAAAFAGRTNPVNLDNVSEDFVGVLVEGLERAADRSPRLQADPDDVVAGAEVKLRELGPMQVAAHGVFLGAAYQQGTSAVDQHTLGVGASVEVPSLGDIGSLYLEGAWQRHDREDMLASGRTSTSSEDGLAAYGLAELFFGDVSVLVEGLYLDAITMNGSPNAVLGRPFAYNQPPTLERIDQEVLNNRDVLGGRVRVDYTLLDGDMTVYGNGMLRKTDPGEPAEVTQIHAFGGIDLYYDDGSSRLAASGGWRDEDQTPPGGEASDLKSMTHAEGEWLHAFDGWALHVATLNEFRTLASPTGTDEYIRGSTLAGLEFSRVAWIEGFAEHLSLTFEFGYDDQDESGDARNLFYAGIVDWTLDGRLRARATVGTQRGGLKCIGGVCRIFPEFAGARLDLITTLDL